MTLAFDVYGTLIDTAGVVTELEKLVGERARQLSDLWRAKQLEYSFRRGLMQDYRDFRVCTAQALDYACQALRVRISQEDRQRLMAGYRELPAYPDVPDGLRELESAHHRMFAFSNGRPDDLRDLLGNAGIEKYFADIVSTDEVKSFKPNLAVYAHLLRRSESSGAEAWMVSSNPFDVIGAMWAGMAAVWVRRSPDAVFDPWEIQPTATVSGLGGLRELLLEKQ
jgi:2-haloacid dehalogenase